MKINKLSIKSKIAFWYIGLMISLAIIFLTTIIYISENLIRANAYKNLKNSVVSAFDEIEVYDGELTIDNDFIIFNNNVHLSVYNDETGFIYGDIPLDFEYDETFSDKNDVRIIKHKNKKWYIFDSKKNFSGYGIIHIRGIAPATEVENVIETIVFISLIVLPFFLLFSAISGYFITKKAFKPIEKIREAAEKINEGKDVLLEIEFQGALQIKKKFPEALLVFITPPDAKTLKERLIGRGTETIEQIEKRLHRAVEEARSMDAYDYIVVNDDLDQTVKNLHQLIEAQHFDIRYNKELIQNIQDDMEREYSRGKN